MTHARTSELSRAGSRAVAHPRPAAESTRGADLYRRTAKTNVSLSLYCVKKIKITKRDFAIMWRVISHSSWNLLFNCFDGDFMAMHNRREVDN